MMELRQLSHFLSVAETLSFSATAEKFSVSVQAVSKSIRQLEFTLGVKIFDRDTRTVSLTPFGDMLLPHARAIEAEVRQFERSLETSLGAHAGLVRVGATPTAITRLIPEAVKRLILARPAVRVEIERGDFTHLSAPLLRGELDMIVSTAPTETVEPLIAVEPLMNDANVVVAAAGHPFTRGRPKRQAMESAQWIALRNFVRGEQTLKAVYAQYKLPPPAPALVTTAVDFAVEWIADGPFLGILPLEVASSAIVGGRLSRVNIDVEQASWPIVLAYRRNATRSPAALSLIDMLKDTAKH